MTPLVIYQTCLDAVSRAVLTRDFDAYIACYDLPFLVRTAQAHSVIYKREDMRPAFEVVADALQVRGVTHYERVAREADQLRPDRIVGWHFTHMITQGERVIAPHAASEVLVCRNGAWLVSEANYPLLTLDWPPTVESILGPKGPFGRPEQLQALGAADPRPQAEARA